MDGRRVGLPGRANSPESVDAYRRILNDYLLRHARKTPTDRLPPAWALTLADLVLAWLDHCRAYYAGGNTRSNEYDNCRYAVRPLVALRGDGAVVDFRPEDLKAVREAMITGQWASEAAKKPIRPWSRPAANAAANRIKRMFRWGVEAGLVPHEVSAIIAAVAPLKKGRTVAREPEPVQPVDDAAVDATLPELSPVVADMVRVQRLTGMRSDNLCALRPCDLDRSGDVWIYMPRQHKGSHQGRSLAVPLGPKCQAVLAKYLERPEDWPCFCPADSRPDRKQGRRLPRRRYTSGSYATAIRRAIVRANHKAEAAAAKANRPKPPEIPHWHPHQLRHTVTASAKRAAGLDGARAYLGHAMISTTKLYEARDLALAVEIARAIG
jgi:integrase